MGLNMKVYTSFVKNKLTKNNNGCIIYIYYKNRGIQ